MTFQYSLKTTWLLALGLVLWGDFLFYHYYLGTNIGLFCLLLVMVTAPFFKGQWGTWLVLILMSISLLIDITFLNFFFFMLAFTFLLYTRELKNISYSAFFIMKSLILFSFHSIFTIVVDFKATIERTIDLKSHAKIIVVRIIYWSIAMGVSGLFLFLFYLANPYLQFNIERFLNWLAEALAKFFELYLFIRIAIWVLIFISAWAFLRTRKSQEHTYGINENKEWLPLELIIICLSCFNLVFAIQNISDLYFLIGNGNLPNGLSYAEYAHRGAYPLIVVTLLSGALICFVFKEGFASQKSAIARKLVYLWLLQNILLVVFTFQRLVLYVSEYHLTRWRYATFIWLLLIVFGLLLTFYRIQYQKSNQWYLRQNMFITFWILLICCFVKSDSIISFYNVAHCKEYTGKGNNLDIEYLESLGVSALPSIQYALDNKPDSMGNLKSVQVRILEKYNSKSYDWREKSLYESFLIYFTKAP